MIVIRSGEKGFLKDHKSINFFHDLNIDFKPGNFYIIIGKSGAGKSTLINILGLLDTLDKGSLSIDDVNVDSIKDDKLSNIRMNKVGIVFQDYYLNPRLTAYDNVI
jgi:ABC-type lipoprotein export system ATPase subunit